MEFITKSELRDVRNALEKAMGYRSFSEIITENVTRKSKQGEVTIFLSHKHDETEELKDAIAFLKKFGVAVYIDHNDEEMPTTTSGLTAARIKTKIKENRKFVLLATERAINSKWCNWELGFGDAHKYIDNIALLIVKEDNKIWTGSEYLQIYPIISKKHSWSTTSFEVQFPSGKIVDLETWLRL